MKPWELHPGLVHFPVAFLIAGVAVDIYATMKRRDALARIGAGLLVAGVATGWIGALTGILAWFTAPRPAELHPLMYWHPALAALSMLCFTPLAISRWRRRSLVATPAKDGWGAFAAMLMLAAAYLGGHLVYRVGTGVAGPAAGPAPSEPQAVDAAKPPSTAD